MTAGRSGLIGLYVADSSGDLGQVFEDTGSGVDVQIGPFSVMARMVEGLLELDVMEVEHKGYQAIFLSASGGKDGDSARMLIASRPERA